MRGRASVNNQRDAPTQFIQNVLSGRGADSAKPICARCGERFSKRGNDFSKNGMRTYSHGDGFEPGGHDVRNDRLSIQDKRERAGPEMHDQFLDLRAGETIDFRHALQPFLIR